MRSLTLVSASWQFRDATRKSAWRSAVVPGCVHTDLRRHKLIPDPFWSTNELDLQWIEETDWEYRTTFHVSASLLADEHIELVADGLDTVATVRLNGHEVARTDNMFTGWRWEVKPLLRAGPNELTVFFGSAMNYIRRHRPEHQPKEFNDPVGRSQVLRKQPCQFGWDWGPRFVTAGIWRDLRLEAWSTNRLEGVRLTQRHVTVAGNEAVEAVILQITPEFAHRAVGLACHHRLTLNSIIIAEGIGPEILIEQPQLWWPNGHGAQPLYLLEIEIIAGNGRCLCRWSRRLGLRTIQLDRHPDPAGETFRFVVNGRPLFAKGANWIPAHSFVAGLKRDDYARDLRSAAAAHMNMIRVWGGGIYESDDFYDLCDELGLMVWQDFMFACTIYPGDAAFLRSVKTEAAWQVRRLRHHASLALWCGNNEIESLNRELLQQPKLRRAYDALFHDTLPAAVARYDAVTDYWPSSPHRGAAGHTPADGEKRGDTHFWDVWHARHPVKDYEKWRFRFVSEFGMQSYSSPETNATFCPPHNDNIFGHEMENHQKNRAGNQIILDYISRLYRFPKNQDALIYLSQLNQAHCMQVGVEHYRRLMPHCMGALYWQLNDCWPVASWSSIEFTGRWRALHHVARRFFAPAIVSAHVPGGEDTTIGNYRQSTVRHVHLYTISDLPETTRAELRWDLLHLDERVLLKGRKQVILRYGQSVCQRTLDLGRLMTRHGRDNLHLRIALWIGPRCVSEDTVFLTPPRYLQLNPPRTGVKLRPVSPTVVDATFTTTSFQHRFAFDLPGIPHHSSDNYFELYPDEPKTVRLEFTQPQSLAKLRQSLTYQSLVDTY
jgi:beta-mannosidase